MKVYNNIRANEEKYKHFAECVNTDICEKMADIAKAVESEFIGDPSDKHRFEAYGCTHINDISGVSYDGFFAYQNGGYSVTEVYQNNVDSSYHFLNEQTEYMNTCEKNLYDSFFNDNKEKLQAMNLTAEFSYSDLENNPELQREFEEYENEGFDPAILFFENWIDRNEEKNIFFRVSINFKDAPYYRSKYATTIFEFSINEETLLKHDVETFIKVFKHKFDRALKEDSIQAQEKEKERKKQIELKKAV